MTTLSFAPTADIDMAEIQNKTLVDIGPNALNELDLRFAQFFDQLATFPQGCQARLRLGREIRLGVVSPYSLIYRYDRSADHVIIIRILHGRRKITRNMLRDT